MNHYDRTCPACQEEATSTDAPHSPRRGRDRHETPRTDAWEREYSFTKVPGNPYANAYHDLMVFARQLERELAEAEARLARAMRNHGEQLRALSAPSATRDTLSIEHVIAIVTRLIEDVAEDPTRLARAQELARRDILPLLSTRPETRPIEQGDKR